MKSIVSAAVGLTVATMVLSIPGLAQAAPTPTPTPTPSAKSTKAPTPSATRSATPTRSASPSATPTPTPTTTATPEVLPNPFADPEVIGAIKVRYDQLGGASGWLGKATGTERDIPGGKAQTFTGGEIIWSYANGARALQGSTLAKYKALGYSGSALGMPTGETVIGSGGARIVDFTNGFIIDAGKGAFAVQGAIYAKYAEILRETSYLGAPISDEFAGARDTRVSRFANGLIIWSGRTGAHIVTGKNLDTFGAKGFEGGVLGAPVTDEFVVNGGTSQGFEGGQIIASPAGSYAVHGAILGEYAALGYEQGALGFPRTNEFRGGHDTLISGFERGAIYFTENGAHGVYGEIFKTYAALGFENGALGLPTSGEFNGANGARVVRFQNGLIIWSHATGAHAVQGAILGKFGQYGYEGGAFGMPITSEFTGRTGAKISNFTNGQIFFSPRTGVTSVRGEIARHFGEMGYESGPLGMPTSDEFDGAPGARVNKFDGGLMIWTGQTGAYSVRGAILDEYGRHGYERGQLGAPLGDEYPVAGGFAQDFKGGRINFVNGGFTITWPLNVDARCRTGRVMCISKGERKLRWMIDGQVKLTMDARFGKQSTPTREGQFSVFSKVRDEVSWMYGNTPMPFAMYFSGGEAVHYSYDFAARGWAGASHGCVNIRDWNGIQWLYDTQVRLGDKVVVYW